MLQDFKCVTCGACFKSQQYLNRHINRHFAEKKWKCKDCEMAFIDNRDLKVHIRHVHENFRPYECKACHQAYKTKQGLTTHQKAHPDGDCVTLKKASKEAADGETTDNEGATKTSSTEKPFGCTECKKRFTKKSRMESHLRMHSNENKFACSVEGCGKYFTLNQSLKHHMKQIHNTQIPSTSTTPSKTPTSSLSSSQETLGTISNLLSRESSNAVQIASEIPLNIRNVKQENQPQPLITQISQQSSSSLTLPQPSLNLLNSRINDESGRESVISHLSDISTHSRSSVVVVEPRNQMGHQTNVIIQATNSLSSSLLQTPNQQLSSSSQTQSGGQNTLGGMTAQLAVHNASIPSVAAKAAEAVFGRNAVVHHQGNQLRDGRQGVAQSWAAAAVQVNQHSTPVGVSPSATSQFMPLNLQEALVQHQQQNPRIISNAISQVRSPSLLHEASVTAAVGTDQHSSTSFHQMIQQQQQILLQQQQQQEDHQRRLKEQKDQRERETLARERQVREHERQQREQHEHYQRYQLQQQQQLLQQQQQLAAAQAAAQVQQVQAQQSVVSGQQPSSANPSSAGGFYYMPNLH